jgi:hypothetical protein
MSATPAQMRANRTNAARSTGPKTAEGKEVARRNALKHGLAGRGTVMTPDDEIEKNERLLRWNAELRPIGAPQRHMTERAVACSVQFDRAIAHDDAARAERTRRASDQWDEQARARARADIAQVDKQLDYQALGAAERRKINGIPYDTTAGLRLRRSVIGIDWIFSQIDPLARKLEEHGWTAREATRFFVLLDELDGVDVPRIQMLATQSGPVLAPCATMTKTWGQDDPMQAGRDATELDARIRRRAAAIAELAGLLRADRDRLNSLRERYERLDNAARDEAPWRSLVDTTAEGEALRRYQVAAEGGIQRSLTLMLKMRKQAPEEQPSGHTPQQDEPTRDPAPSKSTPAREPVIAKAAPETGQAETAIDRSTDDPAHRPDKIREMEAYLRMQPEGAFEQSPTSRENDPGGMLSQRVSMNPVHPEGPAGPETHERPAVDRIPVQDRGPERDRADAASDKNADILAVDRKRAHASRKQSTRNSPSPNSSRAQLRPNSVSEGNNEPAYDQRKDWVRVSSSRTSAEARSGARNEPDGVSPYETMDSAATDRSQPIPRPHIQHPIFDGDASSNVRASIGRGDLPG